MFTHIFNFREASVRCDSNGKALKVVQFSQLCFLDFLFIVIPLFVSSPFPSGQLVVSANRYLDPWHSCLVKLWLKKKQQQKQTHVPHRALDYDTKWKLGVFWLAKACVILELIRHSSCSKASTRAWLAQPSLSIHCYKKIARFWKIKFFRFSM